MEMSTNARQFTPFEKYYFWRNKLNMYSNFRVAVEYSEELDVKSIFYALRQMTAQHSSLSMNAYENQNTWWFQFPFYLKFMNSYKLSDVLQVIDNDDLTVDDLFDELQETHFEYGQEKPLWSLILLNKKTLVYYSDHLLFDGSSGLNFHKVFSQALKEAKDNKESDEFSGMDSILFDIKNTDCQFHITPKPSELIDYSVPIFYLFYVFMMICFPKFLIKLIKYYFIDDGNISRSRTYNMISLSKKMIQLKDNKDKCKLVHISQEKLQQIISDCRKYKVKLTSLLVVVSLLSISKITGNEKDTMVVIPVNSRNKIKKQFNLKDEFGLYLGDLNLELPPVEKMCYNGEINWNFVKYVNDFIHKNIQNSQRDLGLTSLIDSKIFLEQRKKNNENTMIGTLLVSNLGNLKDDDTFENAYFDQPCKSSALSLFAMNVISTSKGGAHLTLRSVNQHWLSMFNEGVHNQLAKF
jgi:hypothetical protein